MGDGGECSGEDEHADMIAKYSLAGLGLPFWRRALAGGRKAFGGFKVTVICLRACFCGDSGEVVGGGYGIL